MQIGGGPNACNLCSKHYPVQHCQHAACRFTPGRSLCPISSGLQTSDKLLQTKQNADIRPQIQSCLSRNNVVPTTRANLEISPPNARDLRYITSIHTPSVPLIPLSCLRYASQHVDEIHKHPTQLSSIAQIPKHTNTHRGNVAAFALSKFHVLKYWGKVDRYAIYCDLNNILVNLTHSIHRNRSV